MNKTERVSDMLRGCNDAPYGTTKVANAERLETVGLQLKFEYFDTDIFPSC